MQKSQKPIHVSSLDKEMIVKYTPLFEQPIHHLMMCPTIFLPVGA